VDYPPGSIDRDIDEMKVLIVGDGNFSFSVAFSKRFPDISLVATSFDGEDELCSKYAGFERRRDILRSNGHIVLHHINAANLKNSLEAANYSGTEPVIFDSIIFNFPHVVCFYSTSLYLSRSCSLGF
jgi:25S rRNA (uracil2634-N3)-methyltransferase